MILLYRYKIAYNMKFFLRNILLISFSKFGFIFLIFILFCSCEKQGNDRYLESIDTVVLKPKKTISIDSETDSLQRILLFIKEFVEKDFYRAHQELIDQGKEHNYQFTEIKHLGDMFKYSFEIPNVDGYQEYSCIPSQGESTILISGDHQVAKLYFDGMELSKKWDRRDSTSSGYVLELREKWNDYPIITHILVTYLVRESESILIMRRKIIPN